MAIQNRMRVRILHTLILIAVAAGLSVSIAASAAKRPTMVITFETGKVVVELRPDKAPLHVARTRELANSGFYDGLSVVRVAPDHG